MKQHAIIGALAALTLTPTFAGEPKDYFDGRTGLLCTVQHLSECTSHAGCQQVPAGVAVDIRHLELDFRAETVRVDHWDPGLTSSIGSTGIIDQSLVVQGSDAGRDEETDAAAWSLSIDRVYGTMSLAIAGRDVVFAGIGACVPVE